MNDRAQRRIWAALVLGAAIASLAVSGVLAGAAPSPFDRPLKVVRLPLPRDPENPQARARLSCAYFPTFMAKEIDLGEVGAAQLSIVPVTAARKETCRRENLPGEMVISPNDWTGYFSGVKGRYVVFDADDGWNGGTGFAIFSATDGKKLFDDAAKSRLRAIQQAPAGLSLR